MFIDELHTLVGAGSAEGSLMLPTSLSLLCRVGDINASALLRPVNIKSIEKDRSLERRFQAAKVPPPNEEDATKILFGIKDLLREISALSRYRRLDQTLPFPDPTAIFLTRSLAR